MIVVQKGKESQTMAEKKCSGKAHKGHLCVLASEGRFDVIKTLVKKPKFVCFNCGRVADSKKNLCNPMPLEEGAGS